MTEKHEGTGREVVVDVREQLRAGKEPFSEIMAAAETCAVGDTLVLFATFKPVPLLMLLKGHGFEGEATKLGKGDWRVDFHRVRGPKRGAEPGPGGPVGPKAPAAASAPDAPGAPDAVGGSGGGPAGSSDAAGGSIAAGGSVSGRGSVAGRGPVAAEGPVSNERPEDVFLDNRGLEPPQPMVRTLEAIYQLQPKQRIVGKFDRTPMFLLPKLDDMGYRYTVEPEPDGRATVTIWLDEE